MTLTEFLINISDTDLADAIYEIQENEKLGFIKENGLIRKYNKMNNGPHSSILMSLINTQFQLMKEAASRWNNIINPPFKNKGKTKEERFHELVSNMESSTNPARKTISPKITFWFKNGVFMFKHDTYEEYFYCSYDKVWRVFELEFDMSYIEIQSFIKEMIEKYYGLGYLTPIKR